MYETNTKKLYVGDGATEAKNLQGICAQVAEAIDNGYDGFLKTFITEEDVPILVFHSIPDEIGIGLDASGKFYIVSNDEAEGPVETV